MSIIVTKTTLTCPECKQKQEAEMPVNACQRYYRRTHCYKILSPKQGDCCVFCSYAEDKCPPKQVELK